MQSIGTPPSSVSSCTRLPGVAIDIAGPSMGNELESDMKFVKKVTPPDFQAKNFTPSISPNFNSFSKKKHKKLEKMEKLDQVNKSLI